MKGSRRLKAMDERTSHATEWIAIKRTNESSEWTNGQYYVWTNEQTQQSNKRNDGKTDGEWTNGTNKRLQTRRPNKWLKYTYFFFKTKEKILGQFGLEQRKVFLCGLKWNS